MSKTLAYWETKLEAALEDKQSADAQCELYAPWIVAPTRWKKMGDKWRRFSRRRFLTTRWRWTRRHKFVRHAMREREKAERRIAYIEERIRILRERTVWDRVLGKLIA